jgi:hypothetical protein
MKLFRIATAALLFTWCLVCRADPVLLTLFSNHMVLQQSVDIHVWGKADPAEKIGVTLAGREGLAIADTAGRWSVRYAWANSPQCNLFNKDGLPASPFRTDDWPGATTAHYGFCWFKIQPSQPCCLAV